MARALLEPPVADDVARSTFADAIARVVDPQSTPPAAAVAAWQLQRHARSQDNAFYVQAIDAAVAL